MIGERRASGGHTFLLSPANLGGKRARLLLRGRFPLAEALRSPAGAPLGDVFSFLSGLYFRGKLAYARAFARSTSAEAGGIFVITPSAGLVSPQTRVGEPTLRSFARVDVAPDNRRYRNPLIRDAGRLAEGSDGARVVLLGSIATGKYVDILLDLFGERLFFPAQFVGRGDLSRGGLLLRAAREGEELEYVPAATACRHGPRAVRLGALPRRSASPDPARL